MLAALFSAAASKAGVIATVALALWGWSTVSTSWRALITDPIAQREAANALQSAVNVERRRRNADLATIQARLDAETVARNKATARAAAQRARSQTRIQALVTERAALAQQTEALKTALAQGAQGEGCTVSAQDLEKLEAG
ncbi:MAG: hypothetical protein AAFO79_01700 [Pseudomonadota bacterium]